MRMNRRHFNNDKGRFGETNELNLRLDNGRSRRRGFNRKKTAKIVNIHGIVRQLAALCMFEQSRRWCGGRVATLHVTEPETEQTEGSLERVE